ncbi:MULTISPECIES: hypothetical protein [unclassified Streptomyces]|uniref:hypothetical protein n=1 Tax=unclassified Streptomyces TaxID=2593676 RepID=UPI00382B5DF2
MSATPVIHRQLLVLCHSLDGTPDAAAIPAQCKARREYENRVNVLVADSRR